MTAELVQPVMGLAEVEERIARIKAAVDVVWGDMIALYEGQAWVTLGLPSWDAVCDERLGMRPKLPVVERVEAVAELTEAGMSTRAIASTLGINRETVMKDQSQLVGNQPVEVLGLDGRTRTYDRSPITPEMRQAADDVARPDPFAGMTPQQREEIAARAVDLKHWNELVGDILSALAGAKDRRRVPEDLPDTFPTLATAIDLAHQLIDALEALNG